MQALCDAMVDCGVFEPSAPPNHVLINDYAPGEGIDAHRDGPLYAPNVAILSLGSHCSFEFVTDDLQRNIISSLVLPPCGLLVFRDGAYESCLHRVPAVLTDRPTSSAIRLDHDAAPEGAQSVLASGASDQAAGAPSTRPLDRGRRVSFTIRRVLHVL